jgi:hypothetical protein
VIPTPADGVARLTGARLVGALVRRADASLAHGAAQNAAASIADSRTRRMEELRTLRDLRALDGAPGLTLPPLHTSRAHPARTHRRG